MLYDQYFIDELKDRADLAPPKRMNLPTIYWITILLLAFGVAANGQVNDDIRLVDEFDPRLGCETMERQLDSLFQETSNDARSSAYVVINQGGNVFDNAVVYRKAINYRRFRNFQAERYTVILTRGTNEIKVDLWTGINGKAPSIVSSNLAIRLPDTVSRTLFAEETLELVKIDGQETYIGTGNPSCLYWFDLSIIWELLKANEEFDAEFLIKTTSTSRYKKLVAILNAEFREIGLPIGRTRFVYGGRDKEIDGGGAKLASVATTFVKNSRK